MFPPLCTCIDSRSHHRWHPKSHTFPGRGWMDCAPIRWDSRAPEIMALKNANGLESPKKTCNNHGNTRRIHSWIFDDFCFPICTKNFKCFCFYARSFPITSAPATSCSWPKPGRAASQQAMNMDRHGKGNRRDIPRQLRGKKLVSIENVCGRLAGLPTHLIRRRTSITALFQFKN